MIQWRCPQISYQASCGCLSDRLEFPNFFRTIPSDVYQALTMARLTWLLGWTWVGAVAVDNDYGRLAILIFLYFTSSFDFDYKFLLSLQKKKCRIEFTS